MFATRGFARFARTRAPRWRMATGECMNWFKPLEGIASPLLDQNAQRDEASLDAARRDARLFRRDARTPRRETFFLRVPRARARRVSRARAREAAANRRGQLLSRSQLCARARASRRRRARIHRRGRVISHP